MTGVAAPAQGRILTAPVPGPGLPWMKNPALQPVVLRCPCSRTYLASSVAYTVAGTREAAARDGWRRDEAGNDVCPDPRHKGISVVSTQQETQAAPGEDPTPASDDTTDTGTTGD